MDTVLTGIDERTGSRGHLERVQAEKRIPKELPELFQVEFCPRYTANCHKLSEIFSTISHFTGLSRVDIDLLGSQTRPPHD